MRILITGGAGFIGSNLADKLIETNEIIVIDNFNDYYSPDVKYTNISGNIGRKNYKLYKNDICDKAILEDIFKQHKIDVVVHIAASAGVRYSIEKPELFVQTNYMGTVNILELMKKYDVRKLIFASSSSVYGNSNEKYFSENLEVNKPISPYAATKLACEQIIYTYSYLYSIKSICLRFFTVYGPKQRPDLAISKFINLIMQKKSIPVYGDGNTYRDYTYIDDIVSGIVSAIDYNKTNYEIINLGGGEPITLSNMINIIENELGEKAIIDRLPMQQGDVIKTSADISKAKNMLGYQPTTCFKDGIKKFIKSLEKI